MDTATISTEDYHNALTVAVIRAFKLEQMVLDKNALLERASAMLQQHDAEKANLRLEFQADREKLLAACEDVRSKGISALAEMDSLRKSNARLLEERDDLRVELAQAIKLAEEKSATIGTLEDENTGLRDDLTTAAGEIAALKNENAVLKEQGKVVCAATGCQVTRDYPQLWWCRSHRSPE